MATLVLFPTMDSKQYAKASAYWTGEAPARLNERFNTFIANATAHTFEHGDVTHMNKVLAAARSFGRYRFVQKILRGMIPFEYNKTTEQFEGKADAVKLARLREDELRAGVAAPKWEYMLRDRLQAENSQEEKAAQEWDLQAKVIALVKAAKNHGATEIDIAKALATVSPRGATVLTDAAANLAAQAA